MRLKSEDELIARIAARTRPQRKSGIIRGIGDDCAIYRPSANEDLVFTTDMLVEDVHFRRATHPADAVGCKALARGLSDIAAMGAQPRFCLLSLALAPWCDAAWVDGFYSGFLRLARKHDVQLAGGDLSHAPVVTMDIVVCGAVPRSTALRRDTAKAGDTIYVSGRLGVSAAGLRTRHGQAWKRHLRPDPRIDLGVFLRDSVQANSCMDLSDGLSSDLHRLALASGLSAEIDAAPPVYTGATIDEALHGGEDYELLFTVGRASRVPSSFNKIPLTPIGRMRRGRAGTVIYLGDPLQPLGYDHFRTRSENHP